MARRGYHGWQADAWSYGVVVAAMLGGELPFSATSDDELRALVLAGDYQGWRAGVRATVSPSGCAFVASLLTLDPEARSDVAAACKHEWLVAPGEP